MVGTYRLIMSLIVASFHAGLRPWGYRWGVPCVMAFLMISGYGISALWEQQSRHGRGDSRRFWVDRVLRIFPHYLFWLVVTAFIVLVLQRHWIMQSGRPDWINVICNITILPLSFFMYIPSVTALFILPQSWSLSLDLFFYGMFPAIAAWRWAGWICALGGLATFALATAGVLDPESFTYRLLPGTLPYFMLGRALYVRDRPMQTVILACLSLDALATWYGGRMDLGYNRELLSTFAPAYLLLRLSASVPSPAWDRLLGNISYGVYLGHMAVLDCINSAIRPIGVRVAVVTLAALGLGLASFYLVEVPMNRFRRRIRRPDRTVMHS